MARGLYSKYVITKADGSPLDPDAVYFVLRLDTDPAAREAVLAYAEVTPNLILARDLRDMVRNLELRIRR